jgi:predicted metalloendopeptidase
VGRIDENCLLGEGKCIIEQYGNYTEPTTKLKLNGIITQGENIADNGDALSAYAAYLKWVEKNSDEPKLPGLNYSSKQLFWISLAQTWCALYLKGEIQDEAFNIQTFHPLSENLRSKIATNGHSVNRFRVIGSLSNSPEFSKDFQCPEGSNMNPVKTCKVW